MRTRDGHVCGFIACVLVLPAALGCQSRAVEMGKEQSSGATSAQVSELATAKTLVTLKGTMIEKCPVSACWFRLQDDTGVARVDVRAAGFTVSDIPQGAKVLVWGKHKPGGEPGLVAQGLRYEK